MTLPRAIALGGVTVGVLDGLDAIVFFGLRSGVPPMRIFQAIAAGLLGRSSFQGGLQTAAIGVVIHFSIAMTIVAVACLIARRVPLVARHPLLAGVVYGIGVWLFMNFVVVPASAAGGGALTLPVIVNGLAIHMAGVGPPAMFFARAASPR